MESAFPKPAIQSTTVPIVWSNKIENLANAHVCYDGKNDTDWDQQPDYNDKLNRIY